MQTTMQTEIQQAIYAGERALSSLRNAKESLDSAKNWGIFDMLGGGLITNLVKHSKIDSSSSYIRQAEQDIQAFQRELKDVSLYPDLHIEISGFLTFADFFFDGLLADYLVQTKINEARSRLDDAIRQVESLVMHLRNHLYT